MGENLGQETRGQSNLPLTEKLPPLPITKTQTLSLQPDSKDQGFGFTSLRETHIFHGPFTSLTT